MELLPAPVSAPVPSTEFAEARRAAGEFAAAEKADATRRAYRSDFDHFTAWCSGNSAAAMPASIETTASYLASLANQGRKVSTIMRRAAAIGYAHRLAGHASPTSAEPVKAVMRGIRRTLGIATRAKAPATAVTLRRMLKFIPDTLIGKRDRAIILIGFAAALRRSELVDMTVGHIERTPDGIFILIPRSKTDQEGAGHTVAVPRGTKLKPVEALEAWLAAAGITDGHIFRPIAKGGHIGGAPLTDHAVACIVKKWAVAAGFDAADFAGHSLRSGFVTEALSHDADLFRVMDVTRHRRVETLRVYDKRAKAFRQHAGKGFL